MPETTPPFRYISFENDSPYRRYIEIKPPRPAQPAPATASTTTAMTHGSYGALLFHPKWKAKRKEILARDLHRCVHCKRGNDLQVHHRQYHFLVRQKRFRLPWEYPDHLLITLCESCHSRGHNKYKVPTINI